MAARRIVLEVDLDKAPWSVSHLRLRLTAATAIPSRRALYTLSRRTGACSAQPLFINAATPPRIENTLSFARAAFTEHFAGAGRLVEGRVRRACSL